MIWFNYLKFLFSLYDYFYVEYLNDFLTSKFLAYNSSFLIYFSCYIMIPPLFSLSLKIFNFFFHFSNNPDIVTRYSCYYIFRNVSLWKTLHLILGPPPYIYLAHKVNSLHVLFTFKVIFMYWSLCSVRNKEWLIKNTEH